VLNNLRQNAYVEVASNDLLLSMAFPDISKPQNQFNGYVKCRYEWLVRRVEKEGWIVSL